VNVGVERELGELLSSLDRKVNAETCIPSIWRYGAIFVISIMGSRGLFDF